jgi:membrane protein insertase Oxa1/YidC/SpoIIIJ
MSFDPHDPQDMGALINAFQGDKQIDLQRQILEMQKLQVLNQVRMSQGLPPLAQLPQPPPPPPQPKETPLTLKDAGIAVSWTIGIVLLIICLTSLFK